ncbi:3-oxoacyl-ACP reductase [Cellulosimicrobium marinum]|uniref:3-oxoacyl-ACP reductase n=1 Tax=Cellulosimicrobium marinum TaxID=1638992 RepID=UPI001E4A5E8E|nr:3-oxoacyl-ACP reductase [Cellulosimicrobium marinum]MCB7135161.1 3-oxoacyl-ACP reductase [Cellulosimicrobium marinum]
MTDSYVKAVNSGFTKTLAKKLGLPRPAALRRHRAGDPLTVGPVLVLGGTPGVHDDADRVATALLAWDLDVRQSPDDQARWGAIVVVLSGIERPEDTSAPVMALSANLRRLAPNGRVVTVSRAPGADDAPELAAAREGVDGFLRSVAKELRYGATGNGVQLTDGAAVDSPSALATLRFFLSAKSAFVDGQLLRVGDPSGVDQGSPSAGETAAEAGAAASEAKGVAGLAGGARGTRAPDGSPSLDAASPAGPEPTTPAGPDAATPAGPDTVGPEHPLAGKVAVVTGAARGIGAQVARTLARDGAKVVVVDVPAAGESLAAVANEIGGTALQLDVTADDAGARILEHARARHGGLDVLVHNAGILRDKLLANMSADKWDAVVAVNLAAQLRITEYLLGANGFSGAPRVVSLASTSGIAGNRGQANYAFSKAGVIGHTRAFARLLDEQGTGGTANAVAPGFIETDMTASIPFVTREVARRVASLQQGGQPVDVAEAIAFLASPGAAGVNGQVLRVCGQNLVGR